MKATIKIKNGYWMYNGTPIKNCSFPVQELVASFIKKQIFTIDVQPISLAKPAEWMLSKKTFTIPNFSRA